MVQCNVPSTWLGSRRDVDAEEEHLLLIAGSSELVKPLFSSIISDKSPYNSDPAPTSCNKKIILHYWYPWTSINLFLWLSVLWNTNDYILYFDLNHSNIHPSTHYLNPLIIFMNLRSSKQPTKKIDYYSNYPLISPNGTEWKIHWQRYLSTLWYYWWKVKDSCKHIL